MKSTRFFMAYGVITFLFFVFGCNKSSLENYAPPAAKSIEELVPEADRIIQEGLSDYNPLVRANTIETIAATKQVKFMPKVERLLRDRFVPVRFAAVLAIGDCEYFFAENSVKQLLVDKDDNVRIAANYAMSKLGSGNGIEPILEAIRSRDQTVRANAAFLLGKMGDKRSLRMLWWTLQQEDSGYKAKFNAAEAIARLGDERIDEKLLAMLISAYADDRAIGVKAMGALGTAKAKDFLITKLDDDVVEVRLAAAEQLGMLGDTAGEAEVYKVFMKNLTAGMDKEEAERVNTLAALAIGQIGTSSLKRFLPQLLENESKFVRIAAAKAVFQCTMKDRPAEKTSI